MNEKEHQNIKRGYLQWGFYFLIYNFYSFQIFIKCMHSFYNEKREIIYQNVHIKKSISQIMKEGLHLRICG